MAYSGKSFRKTETYKEETIKQNEGKREERGIEKKKKKIRATGNQSFNPFPIQQFLSRLTLLTMSGLSPPPCIRNPHG